MSRKLTFGEVAAHTGRHDLYVVIHGKVLDLSNFVDEHPGGEEVLVDQAGKDATEVFEDVSHSEDARQILETLVIGSLDKTAGSVQVKPSAAKDVSYARGRVSGTAIYVIIVFLGLMAALGAYRVRLS